MSKTKEASQIHNQAEIIVRDNKRYLKTPKGTELPLLQLRGKDYLQVAHRLVWFREEHPDWQIITKPLEINSDKKYAIFRSQIKDDQGKTLATATKAESIAGFADYIEKAETGATGRAVALCGFGTQFAPEFDEEERLADSPITPPRKTAQVVNPDSLAERGKIAAVIQRETVTPESQNETEVCKNCGSNHLTIGLTKPDNPRNPNRPYWKCLDCPAERSFSHWVKDAEHNPEAAKKVAARQQKLENPNQIPFE